MQFYLPIAEMPVNVLLILGMGLAVGFISGMFGIGGGFLLTPLLIVLGIPPAVAVASVSGQIAAAACSTTLSMHQRKAVDFELGWVLLFGSFVGAALGTWAFVELRRSGQLDLFIAVSYVTLLGGLGIAMIIESGRALLKARAGERARLRSAGTRPGYFFLPITLRFPRSKLAISVFPVVLVGAVIGALGAVMGIGGGFILLPALTYLLRVPSAMVVGTTSFQTLISMVITMLLHALMSQALDVVLSLLLMLGGAIGAQFGARAGTAIRGESLRLLLGILILGVGLRFLVELVVRPADPFSLAIEEIVP